MIGTPSVQTTTVVAGRKRGSGQRGALSAAIFALASVTGVLAFAAPFFMPAVTQNTTGTGGQAYSPLFLATLLVLSLAAMVVEAQGRAMNAKLVALLGVLVAINSALRFAENLLPGPGGFTPVFMLIITTGYVFGARLGFLMGALSLLVSAVVTGGVGPWLPYQMFTAGWMGLSAGWLGAWRARREAPLTASSIALLILFSAMWGFLYGAIMNLWSWPFLAGDPAQSWQAGLSVGDGLKRYAVFYVATSLWWDAFAALGNIVLIALFGPPTLQVLMRFQQRFLFKVA